MTTNPGGADEILSSQESEYWFPYHYVAQYERGRFKPFFYDGWALNYAASIELMLEQCSKIRFDRIVDIGCGDGRLSREVARAYPSASVTGVDVSGRAVSLARAMNQDVPNVAFRELDITAPHDVAAFDAALLMEVLEHVPPHRARDFVLGCRRLLRPGGVLLLTVPHSNKAVEYKHFQHFTIATLREQFGDEFLIEEIVPFERISRKRKAIDFVLANRFFLLKHPRLLSALYAWYKQNLMSCSSEAECQRLFLRAVAR